MGNDDSTAAPTALVTGASSGIGRATALTLANSGYRVFAAVRRQEDGDRLVRERSGELTPVLMDVTNPATIARAYEQVADAVAPVGLTALVNVAGIGEASPMETVPIDALRRIYDVNVIGQVAVIQAFLPLVRSAAGRIVNIGSIGDRLTMAFAGPLTSSKWAFASITEALRLELRPWGIHVILVEPASIHTDAVDKLESSIDRDIRNLTDAQRALYADDFRASMSAFIEQERAGDPPEVVAHAILRSLTARKPKTRYIAGKDGRRLAFMAAVLPDWLFDRLRVRMFGLPREFGAAKAPDSVDTETSRSL